MKAITVRVEKTVFADIKVFVHDERDAIPKAIEVAAHDLRPIEWLQTDTGHSGSIIKREN